MKVTDIPKLHAILLANKQTNERTQPFKIQVDHRNQTLEKSRPWVRALPLVRKALFLKGSFRKNHFDGVGFDFPLNHKSY